MIDTVKLIRKDFILHKKLILGFGIAYSLYLGYLGSRVNNIILLPIFGGFLYAVVPFILFGREDKGLTNEELAPCQALVSMPTHPGLSSLNLAQAVMIFCYELYMASLDIQRETPSVSRFPRPAEFQKMEGMYAHLEDLLTRIGFLDPKNPKRILHTLRRIFGRANLSDRDVAILRGIFRQLEWYATRRPAEKGTETPVR